MTASADARANILGRIRRANDGLAARRAHPGPAPRPGRAQTPPAARAGQFTDEAKRADATVVRVAIPAEVPGAVATYLAAQNLGTEIRVAGRLKNIPWSKQSMLTPDFSPASDSDAVAVAGAAAGVSETGTLVMASGPDSPTRLNLLADTLVVVLDAGAIETSYEDVWAKLRVDAHRADVPLPRTVNWITGPSRTADLEQTLLLGAHGPRRLHIILVDDMTRE